MRQGRERLRTVSASVLALLLMVPSFVITGAETATAIDVPPSAIDLYIQTSGPSAGINVGDWYTAPTGTGGGGTDHQYPITVPSGWPAGAPITVALFDPESFDGGVPHTPSAIDEVRGGTADQTTFTLFDPVGGVIQSTTFTTSATDGQWYELFTFTPGASGYGRYTLRVTTGDDNSSPSSFNDDDNSWRLAVDHDPDCAAGGSGTCAGLQNGNEVDDFDGLPGTGDELNVGIDRGSFQHGGSGLVCNTYFFQVSPTTPRDGPTGGLMVHNFDMDNSGTITYTDPLGGLVGGTVSGGTRWNNSTDTTRVGDELPSIDGWWSAEICLSPNNQYIFEAPSGSTIYLEYQPQTPQIALAKDDGGLVDVNPSDTITYTIVFDNTSDATPNPGQAVNVVLSDAVPAGTTYVGGSCAIAAPFSGSCAEAAGTVTFAIAEPVNPGTSGQVSFDVVVDSGASGTISNQATADFDDLIGGGYRSTSNQQDTPVDRLPGAVDDSYSVLEDGLLAVGAPGVMVNDGLGDTPTSVTSFDTSSTQGGSVSVAADGSFTFAPAPDFVGIDTFTYTITDADGDTSAATVTVDVTPTPDAAADGYAATEDTTLVIADPLAGLIANDDQGAAPATVTAFDVSSANGGSVNVNPDGTFTYDPPAGFAGVDTFSYTITDANGSSSTATVTVTVDAVPDPLPDSYTTDEDTALSIGNPFGVLANDDQGDAPATVTGFDGVSANGGSVSMAADGTFTYDPPAGFAGVDTFTYTITDANGDSGSTTVTITVNGLPGAVDDSYGTDEGVALVESDPLAGLVANDDQGDAPATVTAFDATSANGGSVSVNPDGTFTYTPAGGFAGADSFDYTITDANGDTSTATVTVLVDAVPDPVDDSYSTLEDTPLVVAAPGVMGNDDGGNAPAVVTSYDASSVNAGTVSMNPDGSFSYTPAVGYSGMDTFTYTITDANGDSGTATVTVDVIPVNDPPTADDDTATTPENVAIDVDVLTNDSDPDGSLDPSTVTIVTPPMNGTVSSIDPTTGVVRYLPDPGYSGPDDLRYEVCDDGIPVLCDQADLDITVTPNNPPTANNDATSTSEDTPVTVDVVANDTDSDGTVDATTVAIQSGPSNGTITAVNPDGTVDYTPDPDWFGVDSFTYTVRDDDGADSNVAIVTITVTSVDDLPLAVDDTNTVDEDAGPVAGAVLNNDSGLGDGGIVVTLDTDVANGSLNLNPDGTYDYTPDPDFFGSDIFVYEVCDIDGDCDTATVTITVNPLPDAPTAVNDTASTPEDTAVNIPVSVNDSDPDGDLDPATVSIIAAPSDGTITAIRPDGSVDYLPDPDFTGADTFTYRICDTSGLCDTADATVTVTPVADPPSAQDDIAVTDEDVAVLIDVVANDTDPEGNLDPASLTLPAGSTGLAEPASGTVTIDAGTGQVLYTPDPGVSGPDSFQYEICDATALCATATVSVVVNAVNDAPVAADDGALTAEDTPVVVDVVGNDVDPDGDPLSVVSVTSPADGSVVDNGDGSVTYSPDPDFFGTDSFTYTVCDNGAPALCDTATVTVDVTPVNDPPTAGDDAASTTEDVAVVVDVVANDADVDGTVDPASVTIVTPPANGTITAVNPDGSVDYLPDPDFSGGDSFTYTVLDNDGAVSNVATVVVTVNSVNDAPAGVDDASSTPEDTPVTVDVVANDTDPDGDPLSVASVAQPPNGTVVINVDDTVTYTPDPDFFGVDTFTYQVCDPDGACDTATVTIDVTPIADPPTANNDATSTEEGFSKVIMVPLNDTDPEGNLDVGTVVVGDGVNGLLEPANGSITSVNPDGSVVYAPAAGFVGVDTFEYRICDTTALCDTALVTVTVTDNSPPVAADDTDSTNEDTAVTVDVVANDSDPDGDPLTVASNTQPANGTAALNPDDTITYTPNPDFTGTDTFTYTICDPGGLCSTATVTVDAVALSSIAGTVWDDLDLDGIDESGEPAISGVTLVLDWAGPDGIFGTADDEMGTATTVSAAAYSFDGLVPGRYRVTIEPSTIPSGYYVVSDFWGPANGSGEVSLAAGESLVDADFGLALGNTPPQPQDDTVATVEDTAAVIPVLANDVDPQSQSLDVTTTTSPGHGTVVINPDNTITYTPDAAYGGPDSFTYTVCETSETPVPNDPEGLCATATVTVSVVAENDAPQVLGVSLDAVAGAPLPPLDIDDEEGHAFTAVLAGGLLPPGVTLRSDGTFEGVSTPGVYAVDIQVCDDQSPSACGVYTVTIRVAALPGGALPVTGLDSGAMAKLAASLIGGGVVLLVLSSARIRRALSNLRPPWAAVPMGGALRKLMPERGPRRGPSDPWGLTDQGL